MTDEQLLATAREARERAYAPYSHFAVGAAVLTACGRVFSGANVENAAYGLTLCAERVAVVQALMAGAIQLVAVAVVAEGVRPVSPCGSCRQVLAEFAHPDGLRVIMGNLTGMSATHTLDELLPTAFGAGDLGAP